MSPICKGSYNWLLQMSVLIARMEQNLYYVALEGKTQVTSKDERKRSWTNANLKIKTHTDSNFLWVQLRPSP
jgi:hypothetical protein